MRCAFLQHCKMAANNLGHAKIDDFQCPTLVNHDIGACEIKMTYVMTVSKIHHQNNARSEEAKPIKIKII